MKNIFYFFNYIEWCCIILSCFLLKYLIGISNGDSFLVCCSIFFFIIICFLILAMSTERQFYTHNAYKYKCVYKTHQIIIGENIYYVPIVEVYTHVGSRYIRLINNEDEDHISSISLFHFKSRIAENGFEIPDEYKTFCYNTEEAAYYEIANCKKYIDKQKMKYSRKMVSNEVTVEFKN